MGRLGCDKDGLLNDAEFSKPMPLIGLYVGTASLICALAMGADLVNGFRFRKFWFPCKFFSLNATSLTFIGVAIKLSVDLNTSMPSSQDQLVKLSSNVFICTAIGNSMPSLGIMGNNDLLMNIMALGILIITVIVNICIQLDTGAIYVFWKEHALIMFFMLVMFTILSFSAITVPTTKHYLELKYKKKYEVVERECPSKTERIGMKRLKENLMKFWIMAHTSSPQFVMGRSVTCTASGFLCLLSALTLGEAMLRSYLKPGSLRFCRGDSDYKWSTILVLVTQTTAVVIGTIAPAVRWFTAVNFRCPVRGKRYYREEFHVENYWVQRLIETKECPLNDWFLKGPRCRKLAHGAKGLIMDICIAVQYGLVIACKVIRFISVFCVSRILLCFFSRRMKSGESESEQNPSMKLDLTRFVLHLEGEDELVELMERSNLEATDHWIEKGKETQPKYLIELLEATTPISRGFPGIRDFDSDEIPSLTFGEPPNCWALPLVTLTSIAIALPNIRPCLLKKLLKAVNEALFYVNKYEHILDVGGDLAHIRKAADAAWLGVDLYQKWLEVDLRRQAKQQETTKGTLQGLSDIAMKKFYESKQMNLMLCLRQSPSHWPSKSLAANSMYRISQTMLLNHKRRNYEVSEVLFKEIEFMISDIISGCFCNKSQAISMKCSASAVEVREASVRAAAMHLGRTEKIHEILDKKCIPDLSPDKMARIDEWRLFYKMNDNKSSCTPSSCEGSSIYPASNEVQLSIE